MNASNFSSQCLVLDETQTSNSFKLYSWSNFELTWTQVRPPKPNFEPVLNQKWAKPAEIWKTLLNINRFVCQNRTTIQKNSFEPSKKSQNSEPTNWVRLNTDTRSLRCLSAFTGIDESEMKSDVTTQNFVGNLKNLHSCIPMKWAAPMFFFHSPTINTMYSEIRGLCLMNWPSEMLQIFPHHQA